MEPIRLLTIREFAEFSLGKIKREDAAAAKAAKEGKEYQRYTPLQVAADQTLVTEYRKRVDIMMSSSILWDSIIPDTDKHLKTNAFIFKFLGALEAGVEEYHAEPNGQSPVILFRSEANEEWESEILALPECRQTTWHKRHVEESLAAGGLRETLPSAKRRHIAEMTHMEIKRLESLHAAFRRRQRMMGQQTHGVDWERLCAQWVLDRARIKHLSCKDVLSFYSYLDEFANQNAQEPDHNTNTQNKDRSKIGLLKERKSLPKAKAKSKGGRPRKIKEERESKPKAPGAFRVFTRKELLGKKTDGEHIPDIKKVAEKFRKLSPQERADLDKTAAVAKEQIKKYKTKRVLGLKTRDVERVVKKQRIKGIVDGMERTFERDMHDVAAVVNCTSPYACTRITTQTAIEAVRDQPYAAASIDGDHGYSELHYAAAVAVKRVRESDYAAIKIWHQTIGRQNAEEFSKALLFTKAMKHNVIAVLGNAFQGFLLARDANHVASCCKHIFGETKTSNAKTVFSDQFRQRCQPLMDNDCARLDVDGDVGKGRPCLRLMVCLCSPTGVHSHPMDMLRA